MPPGFRPRPEGEAGGGGGGGGGGEEGGGDGAEAAAEERLEAWIVGQCYDAETFEITDAGLNFALCRMGILSVDVTGSA